MCGTNMVIRREPLEAVGGMCATNIAEDFVTGLIYSSARLEISYVPEVLAEGLAPEDFLSYYKQQLRWARGSLKYSSNTIPSLCADLPGASVFNIWHQQAITFQDIVIMNALIPLVFFFTGAVPFFISTMALAIVFLPYMFLILYTLQLSTNFTYTFHALAFSMGSWTIHIRALTNYYRSKNGLCYYF
jgi:cellulose synthase (UDP-forming)